jgi:ribonuclease G
MKSLIVDYGILFNRIAMLDNGKLIELYIDQKTDQSLVGNVYLGRVVNIIKSMGAIFVDIGEKRNAYLPYQDTIKNGSEIFVQVKKDPIGDKGATLTTDISLSGKYMVLLPLASHISISKRIKDSQKKNELKALLKAKTDLGMILRTESMNVESTVVLEELQGLIEIWSEIESKKNRILKNRLVYSDYSFELLIKKEYGPLVDEIIVSGDIDIDGAKVYKSDYPIFDEYKVSSQIDSSLNRSVKLHQGSFITIDETEALTAIDVNSGKFVGTSNKEETFLQVNLAAAKEIASQLKLRNISGIIMIDFINMKTDASYEHLIAALKKYFSQDRCQPVVHGISHLGLVEVTRKKNRKSLKNQLLEDCQTCDGSGHVKSSALFIKRFIDKVDVLRRHSMSTKIQAEFSSWGINQIKNYKGLDVINFIEESFDITLEAELNESLEPDQFKTKGL